MKITSKTVQVTTRKINCTVKKEQIEDFKNFGKKLFEYKPNNEYETTLIHKYFDVVFNDNDYIHYNIISNKELRKIKLLIIKQDEIAKIIKKIIDNSKLIDHQDLLERKLSLELSYAIDNSIMNELIKWNRKTK
jgi:hypothetical protein